VFRLLECLAIRQRRNADRIRRSLLGAIKTRPFFMLQSRHAACLIGYARDAGDIANTIVRSSL